jgi:polyphosphate kinase
MGRMTTPPPDDKMLRRIKREMIDAYDEELELEIEDRAGEDVLADDDARRGDSEQSRRLRYFRELFRLQAELVKLQDWIVARRQKVVIVFEGRDAAGKGGAIKRITQRLNPRLCRAVALPAPNDRERTQWYFQRYVPHLPAAGEIVLFDRSFVQPCRRRARDGILQRRRSRGILPFGARIRADAGAFRYPAAQVLVFDHR